ncbi:hypothetical protein [Salinibacter altiplanensis]|uniref:hypothetical protein n=1 Tax=Salinibacter altiplanensis TaxID=1803181 RepID=UPI001F25AA05|nr:hypothetical protein [Salinibacter altiplanensis]
MPRGLLRHGLLVGLAVGMIPICAASAQPIQTHLPFLQNESASYAGNEVAGGLREEKLPTPAIAIGIPTARGAEFGDLFGGVSYQHYLGSGLAQRDDGAAVTGLGLGDARKTVGVEVRYAVYDLVDDPFSEGSLSLKVHRHIYGGLSIAVGVEDMIQYGGWDSKSAYVVASQTLRFKGEMLDRELLTGASATVGVGDGRFNTMERLSNGTNGAGPFGGLSVQLVDRINVMGMWYGQDLSIGLSAVMPGPVSITITPAWVSVLGTHTFGDRVALSVGTSLRLP